jgi:hypothetical protein
MHDLRENFGRYEAGVGSMPVLREYSARKGRVGGRT